MSTRSLIARKTEAGFEAIYCHYDGYPKHHGPILTGHYTSDEKVAALMDLGALSILGPELGEAHEFVTFDSDTGACLAYGRDRNDPDSAKALVKNEEELNQLADRFGAEYLYVYSQDRWLIRKGQPDAPWYALQPQ